MISAKTKYFPTTHEELVSLIEKSIGQDEPLTSTFGVGGGQLIRTLAIAGGVTSVNSD